MHGDTPRVSEAAGQFRVSYDKKTGKHFVCWYDKNQSGALVEYRLPHGFTKEATAKSAMHKLRRKAEKQRPRVELSPNRNLYMLHIFIDGKKVRRSLGTRDPLEIPRRREIVMAKLGSGGEQGAVTIREMFEDYHARGLETAAATTQKRFGRIIAQIRAEFGDDTRVSTITDVDLERWRRKRLETIQPISFGLEASCWNAAVNFAISRKTLDAGKAPPTLAKEERVHKQKLVLTREDLTEILAEAAEYRVEALRLKRLCSLELYLHMVRYTGGRASFYENLQWSQVDLRNKLIDFQPGGVVAPKRKRRPTVPIAEELLPVLQRAHDEREPGDDYVLWQRGRPIIQRVHDFAKRSLARSASARMREIAPLLHSHAFRRSYITWGMAQGLSSWLIGQVTGNSPAVIEKYYAQYRPDMGRSVVDSV